MAVHHLAHRIIIGGGSRGAIFGGFPASRVIGLGVGVGGGVGSLFSGSSKRALSFSSLADDFKLNRMVEYVESFVPSSWLAEIPPEQMTEFQAAGLRDYTPAGLGQYLLENIHLSTGTSWWVSIVLLGAVARLTPLPLLLLERCKREQMEPYKDEYAKFMSNMSRLRKEGDTKGAMEIYATVNKLRKSRGHWSDVKLATCALSANILSLFCFFGVYGVNGMLLPSWMEGGTLWFRDLSQPDISLALCMIYAGSAFVESSLKARIEGASNPLVPYLKYMLFFGFPFYLHWSTSTLILILTTRLFLLLSTILINCNPLRYLVGMQLKPVGRRVSDVLLSPFGLRTCLPVPPNRSFESILGSFGLTRTGQSMNWYYDRFIAKPGKRYSVQNVNLA